MKFTSEVIAKDILEEILSSPIPYNSAAEETLTKDLYATLSPEDIETAAQGSYAYWVAAHTDTPPSAELKEKFAKRECRRHLVGVKYEDAVKNITETCKYRRERRIDLYRACFTPGVEFDNEQDAQFVEKLKSQVITELKKQSCYVRGKDKEKHALLIVHPRTDKHTVDEEFVAMLVYIMERAIASTEFVSRGVQEKILVVLDFGTFRSSLAPPLSATKGIASILQHMYSERLKNLVIIDPPFWLRTMYSLIKPFLDPHTKAKFIVASGAKKKLETISTYANAEDVMPFMLPEGKLVGDVDHNRFLKVVPFHCLYDEV